MISLHGVKQALHRGTSNACRWVLESPDDVLSALQALRDARSLTSSPCELFMATIFGAEGFDHLRVLRNKWNSEGHRSNMATVRAGEGVPEAASLNHASLPTREGEITVHLLLEMRRFQQEPGKPESRAVCLAAFPLSERIGCCWDGTEKIPKLLCMSATSGIDMHSTDVYRSDGLPGTTRRGSVTYAVEEQDLWQELHGTAAPSAAIASQAVDDDMTDGFVLEDAEPPLDEITSDGEGVYKEEVQAMANALRRFDAGLPINFLFALHGESQSLLSPRGSSDAEEEEEKEDEVEGEASEEDIVEEEEEG